MEDKKQGSFKTALNYGVVLGLVLIAFSVILYVADLTMNKGAANFSYVFIIGGIYLGIKHYRDKVNGGFVSFGKAFITGFLIVLFASILSATYTYIFTTVIEPGFCQKILDETELQMLEQQNMPEDQVEMAMKYTRMFVTPEMMTIMVVLVYCIAGLIISLIVAAIMKKDNPSFESVIDNT